MCTTLYNDYLIGAGLLGVKLKTCHVLYVHCWLLCVKSVLSYVILLDTGYLLGRGLLDVKLTTVICMQYNTDNCCVL